MRVVVLRTYLDMKSREEARLEFLEIPGLDVRPAGSADAAAYREVFDDVGADVLWVDRLGWRIEDHAEHLRNPLVKAWIAKLDGDPAGLIEAVLKADGSLHFTYFGVRPKYQGRGLGKHLVSYFIERAWELKPTKVWLFTLSVDGEHALGNYLKRGFRIWKRRPAIMEVPDHLAPKAQHLVDSARRRGVHPGLLRRVEAHLRESRPGIAVRRIVSMIGRAVGASGKPPGA